MPGRTPLILGLIGISFCLVELMPRSAFGKDPKLPLKVRRGLEKTLLQYVKSKSEEEREKIFPYLFIHGRVGVDHIATLRGKPGYEDPVVRVTSRARRILGLDLAARDGSSSSVWAPGFMSLGEIALLSRGDLFLGFQVDPRSSSESGVIEVNWWGQTGKGKKLSAAGGRKGSLKVNGTEASRPMMPNTGYTEYDYTFEVEGVSVVLRYVGSVAFACKYPGGDVGLCFSGKDRPSSLSSSDETIEVQVSYPPKLFRVKENLTEYLFSTIPGCERLPLDGEEAEAFSQYEQVQVEVRQTRPNQDPVVLVKFLELEMVGFEPYHYDYIVSFVNEIVRTDAERILVMAGSAPGLEGNSFFVRGKWERPGKKLKAFLRVVFPEAY